MKILIQNIFIIFKFLIKKIECKNLENVFKIFKFFVIGSIFIISFEF